MGLVDVSECEHSVVETIMVKNDATNPLILIDGEEVAGAKQNRIIGQTMLIPPKVNCQFLLTVLKKEDGLTNLIQTFKLHGKFRN